MYDLIGDIHGHAAPCSGFCTTWATPAAGASIAIQSGRRFFSVTSSTVAR